MDVEKIRTDFPPLQQKINGKSIIYFDNACMTLRPRQVIEKMNEYYEKYPGCAGRSIHKFGARTTEEFGESREIVAKFINANPNEIIFTKNTTEGLNLVANSLGLNKGDIVVTGDREHNSNLMPWQILSKKIGVEHKIIRSKNNTAFDLENFEENMNKNVRIVSIVHSSNIDGYTNPVKEIIKISHDYNALVMLDAAQSVPHKKTDVKKLNVDFLAFSGHKMLGPSIGILYGKYELLEKLNPFLVGGDTVKNTTYESFELMSPPEKFEAGLQNYAGALGLAAAVKYLKKIGIENIEKHESKLNKFITKEILGIGGISLIGVPDPAMRNGIVSFNIKKMSSHEVAVMLDESNIMIRSGFHCCHSWFNARKIDGCARVSLYLYNTKGEAEIFLENIGNIAKLTG